MSDRIDQFLEDLKYVPARKPKTVSVEIETQALGPILEYSRATINEKLPEVLSKLPKDHPIYADLTLFGPMGYDRWEVAYTKTFSYLLNPEKIGAIGLQLCEALLNLISNQNHKIKSVIETHAEKNVYDAKGNLCGRADIWVSLVTDQDEKILIFVEAKVDSAEGHDQLAQYEKYLQEQRRTFKVIYPVFLTPKGIQNTTGSREWKIHSYDTVLKAIEKVLPLATNQLQKSYLTLFAANILKDIMGVSSINASDLKQKYKLFTLYTT